MLLKYANYGLIGIVVAGLVVQIAQLVPAFKILLYCGLGFYGLYVLGISLSLRQTKMKLNPTQAKHLAIALTLAILIVTGAVTEGVRTYEPTQTQSPTG